MDLARVLRELKEYDGPPRAFMEVCGTHTAAIFRHGIRSLISPRIELLSGPGCPVCVTPAAYIDACVALAERPDTKLYSFGDMMKVPGSRISLSEAKGEGARVELMYAPMEVLARAEAEPETTHVIAAVGFETTAPAFALAAKEARARGLRNLRLLTALKTVIPALERICETQPEIDGFLCPGHVSAVIGTEPYRPLAARFRKPFVVGGFEAEHLLAAIYDLLRQAEQGEAEVRNYYPSVVKEEGNPRARAVLEEVFEAGEAVWRGLGPMAGSGLYLKPEWSGLDAGSRALRGDAAVPPGCRCADVICGRLRPADCPLFGKACDPLRPQGPCMVSAEGACGIWYRNRA